MDADHLDHLHQASLVPLVLLVAISFVKHLPLLASSHLDLVKHGLMAAYVGTRGIYHLGAGGARIPRHWTSHVPLLLAPLLAPAFHADAQLGYLLDYILVFVFGYTLYLHFLADDSPRETLRILLGAYVLVATLQAAYALAASLPALVGLSPGVASFFETPTSIGFTQGYVRFSTTSSLALVISAVYALEDRRWTAAFGVLLVSLVWTVGDLSSASGDGRVGLVPVVFFLVIVGLRESRRLRHLPAVVLSPLAGYTLLYGLAKAGWLHGPLNLLDRFLAKRLTVYLAATDLALERPLGVGFGRFDEAFAVPSWSTASFFQVPAGAHNLVYNVATEAGLLTAFVLVVWIAGIARLCVEPLRSERKVETALAAVVAATLFTGVAVENVGPFSMYLLVVWWVAFAGLVALSGGQERGHRGGGPDREPGPGEERGESGEDRPQMAPTGSGPGGFVADGTSTRRRPP